MDLKLSVNCGFAINRYVEPEVWGRIVGEEFGLSSVQFVADLLNPFLPKDIIKSQIARIKESMRRYGFSVDSIFTSAFTRVNHLVHPDGEIRAVWLKWFGELFEIGAELGATSGGSHFGILTFDIYDDPEKRKKYTEIGIKNWQKLTYRAKELGYECLMFEPMSIPREFAYTVGKTKELMDAVNGDAGVPMRVCLDIGHAPHPDERDCYPWIEALGAYSPVVHLQQTAMNKSNHWPFTDEYNAQGYIDPVKVVDALEKSGCEKTLLTFELSHREHWDTDSDVVKDHKKSIDYWKRSLGIK